MSERTRERILNVMAAASFGLVIAVTVNAWVLLRHIVVW